MGKAEAGTPKYIANKIKAKGLQKLRWFCQMCHKQCRDENGFKCHTMSESHQRQLLLFADNSHRYIDEFSKEFSDGYLELLKRQFGTKRVFANRVYQDYISNRDHLHMNATKWETLTEYIKWLGREGICVVDETEKGWFITYVDRDPETIAMQEALAKKEKMDKDDQDREMEFLAKQIRRGKKSDATSELNTFTELVREDGDKLNISLNLAAKRKADTETKVVLDKSVLSNGETSKKRAKSVKDAASTSKKMSALDEIMQLEETRKKKNRKDYWLAEGIVVKVVARNIDSKYYKKKAVVTEVIDRYSAKVKMLDSGDKLKLDQAHLETVIPAIGRTVLVLNGGYRGNEAILLAINERTFSVKLEMKSGPLKGRILDDILYEDFSKLHTD